MKSCANKCYAPPFCDKCWKEFTKETDKKRIHPEISARELGENIETIRRWRGLNQKELAFRSDLSCEAVRKIERGRNYPKFFTLMRLCDALGVDSAGVTGTSVARILECWLERIAEKTIAPGETAQGRKQWRKDND